MERKKKGIAGIGLAVVLVIVAGLSMGCIDEEEVSTELDELRAQVAEMEDKMQATQDKATEEAFMAEIAALRAQIEELEDNILPTTYVIVRHTTTELNESFSAWGHCGRGENHIKDKALERAEDFADDLSTEEDITDIRVKYIGRDREYPTLNNSTASNLLTPCYVTYNYEVTWIVNEYEEQIVSAFGIDAWIDCTQ